VGFAENVGLFEVPYELKHSIAYRCWMSFPGFFSTPPWLIECGCVQALLPVIAT
jgi:hypothetical protein